MPSTVRSTDRRRIVPAALVLSLAAATIALGLTGALFTDSDTIGNNTFATGDVLLSTASTLPFSVDPMAPGDTEGPHDVTVSNDGSMEHRYAITSTATSNADSLAEELNLSIWHEADETSPGDGCDETPGNVTTLYGPADLATGTSTINLVGDPTSGSDAGDRVLAAGGSEVLCFYVELPSATGNSFQNASAVADFAFEAEQTASNP